jgi:hypothetical protein
MARVAPILSYFHTYVDPFSYGWRIRRSLSYGTGGWGYMEVGEESTHLLMSLLLIYFQQLPFSYLATQRLV